MTVQRRVASALAAMVMTVVIMAACTETPAAPAGSVAVPEVVALTVPALCEKTWLSSQDGNWQNTMTWLPGGVPTITDEVCITEPGTYTITMDSPAFADSVFVGPGVSVTFVSSNASSFEISEELVVARGATVAITSALAFTADEIINDGSLSFRDASEVTVATRLANTSYLEVATTSLLDLGGMISTGDFRVESDALIFIARRVELAAGRVLGPGTVRFLGSLPGADLVWSGALLGLRGSDTSRARVTVKDLNVTLANTSLVGAIDLELHDETVFGDIGASVSLKLLPLYYEQVYLLPLPGTPSGSPVINYGTILDEDLGYLSFQQIIHAAAGLENRGTIRVLDDSFLRLQMPAFDNRGTIDVRGALYLGDWTLPIAARNFGTINVQPGGELALRKGMFFESVLGDQTGRFTLIEGTVTGGGHLGNLVANGGSISPGPGIQTLSVDRLVLDSGATVQMEVANAVTMDRLRVQGEATYAVRLEISTLGSYIGGICGQLLPMFTDRNSLTGHAPGRFQTFANLPGGVGRYWRAHYATDSVIVAGYATTEMITTTRSTALLPEGGPSATGHVCVNVPVSGADVTVSLTPALGQFTAEPASMTFTSANFALPQPVRYTAVDDALSEGPHSDTLTYSLLQAGTQFGTTPPRVPFGIADNEPAADLAIAIVAAPTSAAVGQNVVTRFRITNEGPGASTGSIFSIPTVVGLTYVSSESGSACTLATGTLTCAVGALAVGASADVLILFNAATVGAWNNTVRVRGNDWDNVSANNSVAWSLSVY